METIMFTFGRVLGGVLLGALGGVTVAAGFFGQVMILIYA
jgi:hypothetical protein